MGGEPSIRTMRAEDLEPILAIERASFPTPWKREHFLHEILRNPLAWNRVAVLGDRVLAYACLWLVDDELAINNLAVHPLERGRGLGGWFLRRVIAEAAARGCSRATLEVRPSNVAARRLYERHGFHETGRRRNYYAVEGEDAIVMTAVLALVEPGEPRRV
jgi:[ribosomal protein S18]-alanine N-acetyltransferase